MGDKSVCFTCRKAFSTGTQDFKEQVCSECGQPFVFFNHKFRPPKRADIKAWQVVRFLFEHGFNFQHVYKDLNAHFRVMYSSSNYAEYPESMEEAIDFVMRYRSQAKKLA